jgi:malonyl-CoA O-methyltransferase
MKRVLKEKGVLAISTLGPATLCELKESFAAADSYPHISTFTPQADYGEREIVTEYYPDVVSLMKHLKALGARNKLSQRRKTLMTHGQMQRVQEHYQRHFATVRGLPVTWEVLYRMERI